MNKKLFLLMSALMIVSLALASCAPAATEAPATAAPATSDSVEVFSWWTGGGEAAGLEAMIEVFGTTNPDVEFVNAAVAGGAGTNARAVLATRLQAGDPPDSWQGHAGQELIGTYVAGGQIESLKAGPRLCPKR
jgi:glucose/mannose transport system substrate-binding protein